MNIDELLADLKQKRDEIRVQINLGSMELRDEVNEEWEEFQQKLRRFDARAELADAREEMNEELKELADDIREGFEKLKKTLSD